MNRRVIFPLAFLLGIALLLLAQRGCTDSLEFEIYALRDGSRRELLAKGRVVSDGQNVRTVPCSALGVTFWNKSVPLWQDYVVGASVYREKELGGFGLWIHNRDGGFSWNWFTRDSGDTYRKLQGQGRVRVTLSPAKEYEELTAIEFLDDVILTSSIRWIPLLGDTHHVVIKKGSVLCLER